MSAATSSRLPAGFRARLMILEGAVFVSMLGVGIIVPFLPLYARDMGASATMMGLIFSSFSASRALAMPYVGTFSDRHGRKRLILIGLAGYAVLALALIWAASPWELVANRVLQGVFAAMILPVSMALVADLTPTGQEGSIFGGFNTSFLLGFGLGPLAGGLIFDHLGLNANFVFMAILSLVSLVMVWLTVAEPQRAETDSNGKGGWAEQVALLRNRSLLGVFLARAMSALGMGCFMAFLPLLAANKGLSNTQLGWLLAVNVLIMTGLQWPCGWLADRLSRVGLAFLGLTLTSVCKCLLPLAQGFDHLLLLCLVEGVAAGISLPALTALAVGHGRAAGAGMGVVMGSFGLALSLGVFVGPVLGGWLADMGGLNLTFYLAGGATLAGAMGLLIQDRPQTPAHPPVARITD